MLKITFNTGRAPAFSGLLHGIISKCWPCTRVIFCAVLVFIAPSSCAARPARAFSPNSKKQLRNYIQACRVRSLRPDFSDGPRGPLRKWDVSKVVDMSYTFSDTQFDGDISKWDVSRVTDMEGMFWMAESFNGDISKWDVSSVINMDKMFLGTQSFNCNISKWDVSRVTYMDMMFSDAKGFKHQLCGAAWVHSTASKEFMFEGSFGSIYSEQYALGDTSTLSPRSEWELKSAIDACLKLSPKGDCIIGEWNVSRVTNMREMFKDAPLFSSDISKWDVSKVTDMTKFFFDAQSFQHNVSKWDVSKVSDMNGMFAYAHSFQSDVSKWDVSKVNNMNAMFT